MEQELLAKTVEGLTCTAVEKICVLGNTDAQADIQKLREVVEDLIAFWDLDEWLLDEFDKQVAKISKE
jgi:hypothetical protein